MKTMYKSIIDYKTGNSYFTVTFYGTLANNLLEVDCYLKSLEFVSANVHHSKI